MNKGMSAGQVMKALNVSATRVRQHADEGSLTFEATALGRLYDPESVARLATVRAEKHARDPRVKAPSPA